MLARPLDRIAALSVIGAIALATASAVIARFSGYELLMLPAAVAMLVVGAWWLRRRPPGSPFGELAVPASVATVMPLLVVATSNTCPKGSAPTAAEVSASKRGRTAAGQGV